MNLRGNSGARIADHNIVTAPWARLKPIMTIYGGLYLYMLGYSWKRDRVESARTENASVTVEVEGGTFTGVVRNPRRGESPPLAGEERSPRRRRVDF